MKELRYRVTDIENIQTKILQEYISLALLEKYPNDSWKQGYKEDVRRGKDGKFFASYSGAWKKIMQKGIDNYSVMDMDITSMMCALNHMKSMQKCRFSKIEYCLNKIQDSRNFKSHLDSNETAIDLFMWICATLFDLKEFVSLIGCYSDLSDQAKEQYVKKYTEIIEGLTEQVKSDYLEYLDTQDMLKTIRRIKGTREELDYLGELFDIYRCDDNRIDWNRVCKFTLLAAEEGCVLALNQAASFLIDGYFVDTDFNKAAQYLLQRGSHANIKDKLTLASLYINGLVDNHSPVEGWELILKLKDDKMVIVKERKGKYIFYNLISKKTTSKEALEKYEKEQMEILKEAEKEIKKNRI